MTKQKSNQPGKPDVAIDPASVAARTLGHDPLAWLSAEPSDETQPVTSEFSSSVADVSADAAPPCEPSDDTAQPAGEDESMRASETEGCFDLGGELTIQCVNEVRERWLQQLTGEGDQKVDGSRLEQLDGAGLQLLVSLVHSLEARGDSLIWAGTSPTLLNGARTLGLSMILKLGQAEVAE